MSPASKHGGTAEIGRFMARTLRDDGIDVDVTQPEDIHDLSHYSGFVIGSALYMGNWLPAARVLVDEHHDALRSRPTWLFSSGPLGTSRPEEPVHPDVVDHLVDATAAREHQLFSGRLELDRLGKTERFIAKWVGAEDGDHREWDDIEAWTHRIAAELKTASADSRETTS